jgi:hypothetical protein
MTTIDRIRRLIAILAAGAGALLALGAASPALAATTRVPVYGPPAGLAPGQVPAQVHTVIVAGMPGWQIALIALAAALAAATVAVVLDRARAARRAASATTA